MRKQNIIIIVFVLSMLSSCIGLTFGPGYSMDDKNYFMERPVVIATQSSYTLSWQYGRWGFYFSPQSKVIDGKLVFSLQGTSSSGQLTGTYQTVSIEGKEKIKALESGGAYWWELSGEFVPLKIVRE